MTRKDYRIIAAGFAAMRPICVTPGEHVVLDGAIAFIADALAIDNGAFRRNTFYEAAGYGTRNQTEVSA